MKRKLALAFILAIVLAVTAAPAVIAAGDTALVYVTIASGQLMTAREPVTVTDLDGDGALTINDAIIAAHNEAFTGGAAAGYATATSDFGRYITKLWGVENGGSYGYYLNNAMAMALTTPVKDGDYVVAFAYTDAAGFSDVFTYFDKSQYSAGKGEKVSLTMYSIGFDENFNPVASPFAGATITVDGKATEIKTDANGIAQIAISDAGRHVISAVSDTRIVPPASVAEIGISAPATGVISAVPAIIAAAASLAAVTTFLRKPKNEGKNK